MNGGRVLVVGGGVAAHGAVQGLREAGFDGEVVVVGREPRPPYERPYLSKRYLVAEVPPERLYLPAIEAEMRLGEEVAEIEPDRHAIRLANGERLSYWRLLLATGGRPRRLPGYQDRLYLRELEDAVRLRQVLDRGEPLEIVGAGFIGCEVAAVAATRGVQVTIYEALEHPLLGVLGPRLGEWLGRIHRARGVDLQTGTSQLPVLGANALIAIGSEPNVDLAKAARLECDGGILVDEFGRTSAPDVYAAGDCARFWSPVFESRVRVEHYNTAHRLGSAVGRSMAGQQSLFAEVPWFWSDQYDLNLQYAGAGLPWDETVVRGRFGKPPFTVFYLSAARPVAALGVLDGRTIGQARRLLERGLAVDSGQLADPEFDLKRLARP